MGSILEKVKMYKQRKTKYSTIYSTYTAGKVSKYGVISGPYFPVFGLNTGKYGPEITAYLDTFHALIIQYAVTKYAKTRK